ncbi:hypothetical protein BPLS_P6363 [Bathymodiolus platifrons methanotrophic gill symbiont]|uniref:hypothetical protein n=1 Tax=Bathymodiolus platifrons methanotrophic gill symbiont TaxID=113268 RepID=UPI001B4CCA3C|nr:hypothetical protein [Bathymodiolus platifrons methanotrophic gill symbiont]GFO77738.1 hypothetical protein BPLS_P6363 [Bathymodiolus platifrons methanotrophic gill symbiont]
MLSFKWRHFEKEIILLNVSMTKFCRHNKFLRQKQKLLIALIATLSFNTYALDGGAIQVVNNTSKVLDVTFSGTGCMYATPRLSLVCQRVVFDPNDKYQYQYDWGVTGTWINVALLVSGQQIHSNHSTDPFSYTFEHPCGDVTKDCIGDHISVDTESDEVDICVISEHTIVPPYPPGPSLDATPITTYHTKCHRR